MPRRAFGYARCSHSNQVENGQTLSVQQEQLRALCVLNGLELAAIHTEEAVSGSVPFRKRPEGAKLWAALQPGDVIVSTRLDRAFRDTEDALAVLEACRKRGVGLILLDLGHQDLTDGAVAKLILSLIASVSSFERDRCSERIKSVKASQKARGRFLGGRRPPFGFRTVQRDGARYLEPDDALQAKVLSLKAREFSGRQITAELMKDGLYASHTAVAKFLRNSQAHGR